MKKVFAVLSMVLVMVTFASCGNRDVISEAAAREKALSHANVAEENATFVKTELERDDGRSVYEIEFYVGGTEYDYEIDAKSGKIISFDSDAEGYRPNEAKGTEAQPSAEAENTRTDAAAEQTGGVITEDEALAIALAEVPGATEADARIRKDYDDGKLYYDVTIIYDNMEYEFEIDAVTGVITERDSDSVFDD